LCFALCRCVQHLYLMAMQFQKWPTKFDFDWPFCPSNNFSLYCTLIVVLCVDSDKQNVYMGASSHSGTVDTVGHPHEAKVNSLQGWHPLFIIYSSNVKQENIFRLLNIEFLPNHKNTWNFICLAHCLITFTSLDTKWSIAHPQFYRTTINSPVRCVLMSVGPLLLFVPFNFFMQQNHINVLIFQSTLSLSSVSRHHNINFKTLCYSTRVLDKYYDTSSAGYKQKAGHGSIDIHTAWW